MARKAGLTELNKGLLPGGKGGGATVPALSGANTAAGGYYSPRNFGADRGSYEARTAAARSAMEEQQKLFREAQTALEASRTEAERKRQRYYDLSQQLSGDGAAELLAGIEQDWTDAVAAYGQQRAAYDEARSVYQPYEDAYNRSVDEYNSYIRGEQEAYQGWKATIRGADEIREEQKGIKEKRAELQRRMQMANDIASGTAAPGIMAQAAQNEAAIQELQAYLGGAGDREKLLKEELDWSEHFRFEDLRQNGDFGEKSRFTGVDNQGDRVYQYVNGNPNAVSGSIDALLDSGTQDDLLLQMMGGNDGWRDIIGYNETPTYLEHMTEDEKAMYNYVYSTQGRDAAQGYLDYLKPELTARKTGTATKFWRMLAGQNALTGALYSGLSVPMNAAGGIQAGLGQVASALRGEELDPNASYNLMANTKNVIRDEVSGKIQEHAGPVGSFAYGTVMSMGDMLMDATFGGPAAMGLIATRGFSESVIDAKERGLSDGQALTLGVVAGAAEVLTEKLGVDEHLHLPEKWKNAGFWKGLLHGAIGEGGEEGITNLVNLAADLGIAGEQSEFNRSVEAYKAAGETDKDAVLHALKDAGFSLAMDVAGGALSGGVFGGFNGWQGKRAEDARKKVEGEKAPSVAEGDSSPIPDGTGEPMGDGTQAAPYEEKAVTAQNGESDVQKTDGRQEEPDAHLPGPEDFVGREGEYPGGAEAWLKDAREDGLVVDADENGGKTDEGEHLLSGGPGRHDAPGAGEPVERHEDRRERQQAEARSQAETAAQRRVKAENLERLGKAQRVSSKDLGLKQGTEVKELLELPRYEWDGELWETVSRIEKETGYKVRTVTGNIGVRLKGGGVGLSRGYVDRVSGTIVMNVAHTQVAAGQIADHELWHWKMDAMGRVSGDRYEMTHAAVQRIQEEYDPEDFDAVVDKYIDGYGDVYDMDAPDFLDRIYEEIMADAYAGINAFGADAAKYRSTVDAVMAENGMGRNVWNAQEQERYAAPGGDGRVYTDEDAPPPRDEDFSQEMPEYDWGDFDPDDARFSMDDSLSREEYERLAAEVAGDQGKRNEEFVKSKLTPEQYKQYKAFAREDRLDQEAEARVRGIERFEEAQAREDLAALRAQQAEDAAAGRRELAAEEKAAKAEAREKAGTARTERRRKAQEKREKLQQEARERIRRAAENAPADSAPTIARKELQDKLIGLFSVGEGQRGELRREIGQLADRMIAEGTVDERDLRRLIDRLYESGVMVIEPEEVYAEGRSYLKDEHIYISPEQIRELGDDWLDLRKKAWGLGVYLTTDRSYAGLDVWNADMASYLPGLFNENETDSRTILERLLHIAQEGKAEKVSLPEYTKRIAKQEHQSEEALLYNMERQVEEALRTFGEKASLEMRLKNRNARRRAMDREEAAIARESERTERERLRQDLKDERAYLKERNEAERDRLRLERAENDRRNAAEWRRLAEERAARRRKHQEAVRKKELRELQEKTLKALQWISKNRRKAPEAMQEAFDAVLGNIDLYAISMADEMNWSGKYGATWKDLKQMYLHAQETDPNFVPSEDLDRIVRRLDSVQLESMDFDQLRDLYQAAVGLRTEFYQRNNVIGSEEHEIMGELYNACVEEMRTAPKKLKGLADRFLNLENLTPMNVFEEMGGFNPDGALYKFAKQLEDGERKVRSFKVRSNKILADFLEDNADWIHRADGQGKDGIWIEVEIPQLIGMKVGEVPEFGGTVKVFMTPMQRVHLYLESRNYDNLRHMTGGRTFADRELYSQGKREEAFAKGTTIRMAPETVQLLVKDMSPEELELARLLDKYYNDLAATEINKVSNVLLGYNKAMGGHYAPIFTNANYTKSEFGKFDGTAEGAGNLKERVKSKNPSYNISALEAFERNMDRTATYVGMAIPVRNWNTLMNWQTGNSSFADEISHSWGKGRLDYIQTLITDLQNPMGEQQDMVTEMSGKLLSNYISSVFGFNPGIVVKQLGSIPMASAYLDWKYFPKKVIGKGKINRELIGRYTQELDWRTMGYSMPETKQLKDAPNWSQKNKAVGLVFGGDAITAMDGWAASVLWPWAENKVRAEFPGLEVGDAAMIESGQSPFYQKVAELFNDAVSRSQSVSDQMHQGRLRKSKHAAAKAFTMFRSDSAQSYNVLRQRLGELDYYRRQGEGGKEMAEAAKKAVGAAAAAVLINSIWGTAWDLLVMALKGKLDEEDKEPLQIAEDFFWGVIDSYAGMVTGGDIIAEVVGGWFTGEKAYSTEAPGIEQFNDIKEAADKIINAGKKGNLIGAIKIAAETVASYGFGLPAKNVEAYLMGLFSWALPGAKVAYEDLLKAPAKEDLKGLEGDALKVRLNHVLKGYGVELEPEAREALAALYEAGYTEAVPSAAPDAVTVDGVELELDGRMKKEYDKTRGGIIEQELPEITGSAFFTQADEKTRKAMVTKLYNYAAEKAKKAVLEDYPIGTTAKAIDKIVRAGGSAADCAIFEAVTAKNPDGKNMKNWQAATILREWDADDRPKGLMFKYLVSEKWEDEQAELRKVGVDVGQFLELYAMHGQIDTRDLKAGQKATEFAYWLDGQRYTEAQKTVIKDQMAYFQMMPADASRYNTATAAGLDRDQALELTEDLKELGKDPKDVQKWRVGIDNAWGPENQLQQLRAVGMDEKTYAKCEALWSAGVAPAAYVRAKELESQFNEDGKGNLKNEEWTKLINSMVPSGIALPGDNERFNLTNEQMGFLWQVLTENKSAKNNPFSKTGGEKWLEIKNADK